MARAVVFLTSVLLVVAAPAKTAMEKGDGPGTIATGYGAVWVGTGGGAVIRIDPRTRRIVQRITVSSPLSVQGLVPAYGSLWVATGTSLPRRIDPTTGRVRMIWGRDWCTSQSLAVAGGAVWVLDGERHRLCRIDPARNRLAGKVQVDWGEPLYLWSDRSRLWLAVNMNPKPPMVEDHLEHVGLIALDAQTGSALGPTIDTAGWIGFSGGFGSLWARDPFVGTLAADTATVRVRASTAAVGAAAVWVLSTGDGTRGTVTKVDPRTNRVVGRAIPIVPKP